MTDKQLKDDYLRRILNSRVYDVADETDLDDMPTLSRRLRCRILLKREDLQSVHSFKLRGAYNKMALLPRAALERGVLAASAGNHAQGVALAAKRLGCKATIMMPVTTPEIKIAAVKSHGASIVLSGDSYSDAAAEAARIVEEKGLTFIPPYDDPDVIAGQGTVAMEILRQHSGRLDAVFVPVGGGGFAAGVAVYSDTLKIYEGAACSDLLDGVFLILETIVTKVAVTVVVVPFRAVGVAASVAHGDDDDAQLGETVGPREALAP